MAKLDVIAEGASGWGSPALISKDAAICVCVTRADGNPVEGLQKGSLSVLQIAGPGPFIFKINVVQDVKQSDSKFGGFYLLFLSLEENQDWWWPGEYVFAVKVQIMTMITQKGTKAVPDEGRTLAKFTVMAAG